MDELRAALSRGLVIPAHPLALTKDRTLDERRQRALTRYYLAAGAGGLAVGVHTTQFGIREAGLLRPVLQCAAEVAASVENRPVLVAGVVGRTEQALAEAETASALGYDAALLSLGAFAGSSTDDMIEHCRAVASVIPLFGFYLQPAAGGRTLPIDFWRRFLGIENVVAIKVAAFDRYETLNVARALAESSRTNEISLYTGNDDSIVFDLISEYRLNGYSIYFAGGLLGQWAVGTRRAVELLRTASQWRMDRSLPSEVMALANQVTDTNSALFDARNGFAGCIPGIHEILRRQGLLAGRWTLNDREDLSPGQMAEIDRVHQAYPHLLDDYFIAEHLEDWLDG